VVNLVRGQPDLDELHRDLGQFLPELEWRHGRLVVRLASEQHDRFAADFLCTEQAV
jgi:hypothetical protein